jgi:hypothetical protein
MTDPINLGNNLGLFYLIGFFKPDPINLVFRSPKKKQKKKPGLLANN